MGRVRQILSDLVAEQQHLDQYLQQIDIRNWSSPTPAEGWDIRDTVSHLAHIEEYAGNALSENGSRLDELRDYRDLDDLTEAGVRRGRNMRPQDVLEWWRTERAKVMEVLSRAGSRDRVGWFFGEMSVSSFATIRLAETWAHGLDVFAAMGDEPEDSERLQHVLLLTQMSLPWAFRMAGCEYDRAVRLEGIGPMYAKYVAGPEDTDQLVRGPVGEICRIALQRLDPDEARNLTVLGETAAQAVRVMRTY